MSKQATLQDLLQELAQIRGLDFRDYKPGTLERRLQKRLAELHLPSYDAYLEYFHNNPLEIDEVLRVVLINVTQFFRDPPAWECLRKDAFPKLLKNLKPGDTFRAWSAGCATGEEVYSLAILLAEHFGAGLKDYDFRLYATDHVELLICRNVLIYFDLPLQRSVMERFRYALEDEGILFLGKAESQMRGTD